MNWILAGNFVLLGAKEFDIKSNQENNFSLFEIAGSGSGVFRSTHKDFCPEVVNYHDETDTYSVNYSELSGLFVESTKELNQKLIDANARINPATLHHVYEWTKTGSPNARLFDIKFSVNSIKEKDSKIIHPRLLIPEDFSPLGKQTFILFSIKLLINSFKNLSKLLLFVL